jgi:hypothetical protein
MTTSQPLHITVGSFPEGDDASLHHDLNMLKAAMLYADRVKLCSVTSSLFAMIYQMANLEEENQIELLIQVSEVLGKDTTQLMAYKQLRDKRERTEFEQVLFAIMQERFSHGWSIAKSGFEDVLKDAGFTGLISALNSGQVELQMFDTTHGKTAYEYLGSISEAVLSGTTYPLLDQSSGNLIELAFQIGKVTPSSTTVGRAKQVGLASNLFSRLPLFDGASVEEIIDIRNELDKPLKRFRAAIIDFSHEVEGAPWEKEFPEEVEQIMRRRIEPAILDIEDAYNSNKPLLHLASALTKSVVPAATSAIGLLIGLASQLPSALTASMTLSAGAAAIGLEVRKEWREKNNLVERNQLYFLYKVKKSLS